MLGRAPHNWWRKPPPGRAASCYRTKTRALTAFYNTNALSIDRDVGMDQRESPVEFEAINHKYALTGKKAARTIAEAMWAALPVKRPPYCLEDIDLEALNDTDAGRRIGGFRLPDWIHEQRAAAEQEAYYRQQYGFEGRTPMTRQSCERMRRNFIKLGLRYKRARGKHRKKIVREADDVELRARAENCAWADRIFGWDIEE